MQGAVFFDRDDTLVYDTGYMYKIADFKWAQEAITALTMLQNTQIPIFIVTNQGGIAKGLFSIAQLQAFHDHLKSEAGKAGIQITDIAYCPHHPQAIAPEMAGPCACRKPEPGMLLSLAQKWNIDLSKSVMIGDKLSDVEAGEKAGCLGWQLTQDIGLTDLVSRAISYIQNQKQPHEK